MQTTQPRGRTIGGGKIVGRIGVAVAFAGLFASCFDGSAALGLPCMADDDCGEDQRCIEGFCGGPPATGGGSSTGDGSTGDSTTEPPPGTDSSGDASTGPAAECGNGVTEPGEECDPGEQSTADCDADCTPAVCGDGFTNPAALEQCDDGNDDSLDECSEECLETLFWDDMEDPEVSLRKWFTDIPTHGEPPGEFMLTSGWEQGLPGLPNAGVWHSGVYHNEPGTARLATEPLLFEELPDGYHWEVQFTHSLRFDGNPPDVAMHETCTKPSNNDGGIVWLDPVDAPVGIPLGPELGEGVMLSNDASCVPPNPLLGVASRAYSGISGEKLVEQELPVMVPPGTEARVVFEVGYDCFNCWGDQPPLGGPPPAGWVIDNVVVLPVPDE